ncbi:GGDEF domain-containing response regulator [Desulfoplanes formicivorans]|uniref:diguanylate cyclase n=1 Tax=Desulfoplanes formicivorans TaxID=1592317 RepID=A0A194AL22_9BACT|nr:diguanylate cyclase [Desulfoplanes formicivorans]GAU09741.1 diguanylate cyclase [Desulfoplanes formicivorans]
MVLSRKQHFFLISQSQELREILGALWPQDEVFWTFFSRGAEALEHLFHCPPDLLVVDNHLPDFRGEDLVRLIKSENVYRQVPVVLCLEPSDLPLPVARVEIDDFLVRPLQGDVVKSRLDLAVVRASRELDASPLTKLPGNTSIIHKIQTLIDAREQFALIYADLDHFKSFNDKYGFSRGDEVLMMTARVIVNTIRGLARMHSFVGHVGGDDFVCTLPADKAEPACKALIENFDSIVPHFYDREDRMRGSIVSKNRQGHEQTFPLMALSLAVVFNFNCKLTHYGQASQIAMNLKKEAKKNPASSYVLDRRCA